MRVRVGNLGALSMKIDLTGHDLGRFTTMRRLLLTTASLLVVSLPQAAMAQDVEVEADEAEIEEVDIDEVEMDDGEQMVVTGSRIRRDEFSSASPLQIISGQISREAGLLDPVDMLQSASQSTGTQIDNTFQGFVLDNGPGSAQINIRGLDPERSLILVNGKRLAPSGVGGAPTTPNLNQIPSIMIDRIELLLDGASSVYGSDAIGGVANVILRKDFDGLELDLARTQPFESGGEETQASLAWGATSDRGSLGFGIEYYNRKQIAKGDRDAFANCDGYIQIDENGVERTRDLSFSPGTTVDDCKLDTVNRVFFNNSVFGNVWYTPGQSNIGIPNFSETVVSSGLIPFRPDVLVGSDLNGDGIPDEAIVDGNGDGLVDVDLKDKFYNYDGSPLDLESDLLSPVQSFNVLSYGEYDLGILDNMAVSFELLYNYFETDVTTGPSFFQPTVPATNPTNPCNRTTNPNGVNCTAFFGPFDLGDFDALPTIRIRGDREEIAVQGDQLRFVGGLSGDLSILDETFGLKNWDYEIYGAYSRSYSQSEVQGIDRDNLQLSLNTTVIDPGTGDLVCGIDFDGDGLPDPDLQDLNGQPLVSQQCVPVNLFAPNIYGPRGGRLTDEEADFLFAKSTFSTEVEQLVISAVSQGDLFVLPWNGTDVPLVVGFEYRDDRIASIPDNQVEKGLTFFTNRDRGASGSRDIIEFFAESEVNVLTDRPWAEELTLSGAVRYTDESEFGSATTYSVKGIYRPLDWFTLRGTYGTSFRAPNLREQFLLGTTGFATVSDPCIVPTAAREVLDPLTGAESYRADQDTRSQVTLDNCAAAGVDPTALGLDVTVGQLQSVESSRAGNAVLRDQGLQGLEAETSDALNLGVVLEQPVFEDFNLTLSVNYFSIEVENSVEELSANFQVNDCFADPDKPNLSSGFCGLIQRNATTGLIDLVDATFLNIGALTSKGYDFNLLYEQEFEVFERPLEISLDFQAVYQDEQVFQFEDDIDDNAGETESPHWRGAVNFLADYGDFRFNWFTRYIGGGEEALPPLEDGATCENLGLQCRPKYFTEQYFVHNASVTWRPETWTATVGVRNVFDRDPEFIDTDGVFGVNNLPLGVPYDLVGRTAFINVSKTF